MKRFPRAFIAPFLILAISPLPCAAQGCKHWTEALAKSFFPRQVDAQGLHEKIAEGQSSPAQVFESEINVDPKDAELQVDGRPTSPGKFQLAVGPHSLSVSKDGYTQQDLQIIIFPDVQPKVKIKLKKLRK